MKDLPDEVTQKRGAHYHPKMGKNPAPWPSLLFAASPSIQGAILGLTADRDSEESQGLGEFSSPSHLSLHKVDILIPPALHGCNFATVVTLLLFSQKALTLR